MKSFGPGYRGRGGPCLVNLVILVSVAVIKGLMEYVRKHSFSVFGWYRIALGILVILYFLLMNR